MEEPEILDNFHGVYMLYSTNPKYLGRTYIGYTVNPNRRVNQHNKGSQFGGARRTSNRGPWDMVLIVHGFPNDVAALRFEWAWQHPYRSRRLAFVTRSRNNRRTIDYCLKIMCAMINVGPWNRLPLVIRWLKPEYQRDLPVSPPTHMPIMFGALNMKKSKKKDEDDINNIPNEFKCNICRKKSSVEFSLKCIDCDHVSHVTCLATHFLRFSQSSHVIPIKGECPKCKNNLLWGDLIRNKKQIQFH